MATSEEENKYEAMMPPVKDVSNAPPSAQPHPSEETGNKYEALMPSASTPISKIGVGEHEEPPVGLGEDVLRAGGAGLERGAAALVGLPGDIGALGRWGGEYAKYYGKRAMEKAGYSPEGGAEEYWKEVEKERAAPERDYVGPVPTSAATIKWAEENLPGAEYEAKTVPGKYAQSIGEMVPTAATALIPGLQEPFVAALGRAAVAGAGGELAAELAPKEYEPYARLAGAIVSPMAATKFAAPALSTFASKAGLADDAIRAMGMKAPTDYMVERAAKDIQRMKQLGTFTGKQSEELQNLLDAEAAAGIPLDRSRIMATMALGDSPSDIISRFVSQNSLMNSKVQAEVENLLANWNKNAATKDQFIDQILGTIGDDALTGAVNNFRRANGIREAIDQPMTFAEAKKFANEVRDDLYTKTYGKVYAENPSVKSARLISLFENSPTAQNMSQMVLRDMNESRAAKGLPPLDFLSYDQENSLWRIGRETPDGMITGAPLEFWDKLAKKLFSLKETGPVDTAKALRKGLDDLYAAKGIENPLKKAQELYGDIKTGSNALDEGASLLQSLGLTPSPAKRQRVLSDFDKMNDAEKGLYQAGFLQQVNAMLTQADGYKAFDKIMKTSDNRELVKRVLNWNEPGAAARTGISNFDRFEAALNIGKTMKMEDAANLLGNTTPVRRFFRTFTAPSSFGIAGVVLNAMESAFFLGKPLGIASMAYGGYKYAKQVLEDQRARKFLNMLQSRDPKDAIALAEAINKTPADRKSWQKVLSLFDFGNKATQRAYRQATAAYTGTRPGSMRDVIPGHKAGGRIKYGPGGSVDDETPAMGNNNPPEEDDRPATDLDENRMFSPTMRAGAALRPAVANQKMGILDAMRTIINKEPRSLYEMIHQGSLHPSSTPDNLIHDLGEDYDENAKITPFELAQRIGETSPVAKPVEFNEEKAPYWKWPSRRYKHGRGYFEMPVIVEPRKPASEKSQDSDIFLPSMEDLSVAKNSFQNVEGKERHSYTVLDKARNHLLNKTYDEPLSEGQVESLKDLALATATAMHKDLAKKSKTYPKTHYPNEGLNAFHVRGQTISPFDGSTFNHNEPFLNIDEVQSDVNQKSRKYKPEELHKMQYSPSALRKSYDDIASSFEEAEKTKKEFYDLMQQIDEKSKKIRGTPGWHLDRAKLSRERDDLLKKVASIPNWSKLEGEAFSKKSNYQSALSNMGKVPPLAPYSDDEKKYTEMAIKLMLQRAADYRHAGISLTPWQEQLIRNGFATPVTGMAFDPKESILAVEDNGSVKKIKVDYQDMLKQYGDPLEEFVGKNLTSILRKNPNRLITDKEHPLFYVKDNPRNASKAERTVQYYHKTLPNELIKYLRKIDPSVKQEQIGYFESNDRGNGNLLFPHYGVRLTDKIIKHINKHGQPAYANGGEVGGSILDNATPIEMPKSLKELEDWSKNHPARNLQNAMDAAFSGRMTGVDGGDTISMPTSLAELMRYRPTRATGGRIPEVDKMFKAAKKELDGETKPMLNVHDDDIVKALRILQGRV
jgi:hypothetical protein